MAISGNDVPNATALTPMTASEIPRVLAIEVAPSTTAKPPRARPAAPASSSTMILTAARASKPAVSVANRSKSPRIFSSSSRTTLKTKTRYTTRSPRSPNPSSRLTWPFMSTGKMSPVINSMIGTSRVTTRPETAMGRTMALTPKTSPMFARFEPKMFPMARPPAPFAAATTATTSSGADVPNETSVSPSTMGCTPSLAASRAAPLTSHSAPK